MPVCPGVEIYKDADLLKRAGDGAEMVDFDDYARGRQPREDEEAEGEGAAVEGVGALLRDRIDDGPRGARELRVELAGQDLELLDRLQGRADLAPRPLSGDVVVVAGSVEEEVVVA